MTLEVRLGRTKVNCFMDAVNTMIEQSVESMVHPTKPRLGSNRARILAIAGKTAIAKKIKPLIKVAMVGNTPIPSCHLGAIGINWGAIRMAANVFNPRDSMKGVFFVFLAGVGCAPSGIFKACTMPERINIRQEKT